MASGEAPSRVAASAPCAWSATLAPGYGQVVKLRARPVVQVDVMFDREIHTQDRSASPLRVVTFGSSHLKAFCGVQAFADTLATEMRRTGTSVCPVDVEDASLLKVCKFIRAVAQRSPDVVAMQYPAETFGRGPLPHFFSLLQRVAPLVITLHEFSQLHPLRRVGIVILLLRASLVISTTERESYHIERWNPWLKGRTRVIPIGSSMPTRKWRPEDPPLVVYFGQIRPDKGLEEFFVCCDALKDANFAVIGSPVPKFASYFEATAAQARQRGIPIISNLTDEQVSDQLAQATVALLPFPDGATFRRSSLLAAAGCGVPIATFTGPDTPENMARLLAPAHTVNEIADLVRAFVESPSLRNQAHLQSVELSRLAGWEIVTRGYLDILQTMLKREGTCHE